MATLVIMTGEGRGRLLALPRASAVTIGRDDQCTFQIVDNRISRKHAQVHFDNSVGKYVVVDARSANGLYLNEVLVPVEAPLKDGDALRLGDTRLIFLERDYDDAAKALKDAHARDEWGRGTILKTDV